MNDLTHHPFDCTRLLEQVTTGQECDRGHVLTLVSAYQDALRVIQHLRSVMRDATDILTQALDPDETQPPADVIRVSARRPRPTVLRK